mmetsp:Transcript_11740/g.15948  ORF Transcript_11740/g.15948 Transcript_11740/m.15948 type:complete len:140 (+) Transcript_11740:118-537(+)
MFMVLAAINGAGPMVALEYWMRPRGFGGQKWYEWAWMYIAYSHLAFWSTPLIGFATTVSGSDAMLTTVAWYIETLSIPELTALASMGELLLYLSLTWYEDNPDIKKSEIRDVLYGYTAVVVITAIIVETIRPGALAYAN